MHIEKREDGLQVIHTTRRWEFIRRQSPPRQSRVRAELRMEA